MKGSLRHDGMVTWERDVSAADWMRPRLYGFAEDVGSVVPEGFDAYARLFHPVNLGDGERHRWSDIARRNGRIVHPEMQLHMISRPLDAPRSSVYRRGDRDDDAAGSLPPPERAELVELLRTETSTPDDCWFCVWEGFGCVDDSGVSVRVELPQRSYLLARGPIERAFDSFGSHPWDQSPSLWWPEDRAWVVATEVDFAWTYVGGTAGLIERLLTDPALEVLPARLHDKPFFNSDVLNA